MELRRFIPFLDPSVRSWAIEARFLRWLTLLWLCLGLAVLFSASYDAGLAESGDGLYYFKRQVLWTGIGLVGFHGLVHTSLRRLLAVSTPLFLVLLGLVFATKVPGLGTTVNGATRWIALGPVPIQPSELIKPFLILQGAQFFSQWERWRWQTRLIWLGLFAALLLGILIQPNLSTTALCGVSLWLIALAAGLPFTYLGGAALSGISLAVISISIKEYQRRRVMSFLDPWSDSLGDGYQLVQSLLAVGSGGTLGAGFGQGQQKLGYLPFQHTDFIFAVFAEEFGLIGSLLLLLMLSAYALIALRVALQTAVPEHRLIAIGAMVMMLGQSLLHIGVAIGALPTTGLPFPLFSAGGSSMLASLLTAALLIRVARECHEAQVIPLSPSWAEGAPTSRLSTLVPGYSSQTNLAQIEPRAGRVARSQPHRQKPPYRADRPQRRLSLASRSGGRKSLRDSRLKSRRPR